MARSNDDLSYCVHGCVLDSAWTHTSVPTPWQLGFTAFWWTWALLGLVIAHSPTGAAWVLTAWAWFSLLAIGVLGGPGCPECAGSR